MGLQRGEIVLVIHRWVSGNVSHIFATQMHLHDSNLLPNDSIHPLSCQILSYPFGKVQDLPFKEIYLIMNQSSRYTDFYVY